MVLKRYYDNKVEILQRRRDKNVSFKDFYSRLKALEEKFIKNNSENN